MKRKYILIFFRRIAGKKVLVENTIKKERKYKWN